MLMISKKIVCSASTLAILLASVPVLTHAEDIPQATRKPLSISISAESLALINDVDAAYEQLKKYPNDPEAYFLLAMAYSKTAYPERAFKALKKAKKLVRKHPKDFAYFDEKMAEYKTMLAQDPENPDVLYRLGFANFLKAYAIEEGYIPPENAEATPQEYYQEATVYLERLIAEHPEDGWAKNYLGYLLVMESESNLTRAIGLWESVITTEPQNPGANALLAEAYMKKKNLKKAIQHGAVALKGRDRTEKEKLMDW